MTSTQYFVEMLFTISFYVISQSGRWRIYPQQRGCCMTAAETRVIVILWRFFEQQTMRQLVTIWRFSNARCFITTARDVSVKMRWKTVENMTTIWRGKQMHKWCRSSVGIRVKPSACRTVHVNVLQWIVFSSSSVIIYSCPSVVVSWSLSCDPTLPLVN